MLTAAVCGGEKINYAQHSSKLLFVLRCDLKYFLLGSHVSPAKRDLLRADVISGKQ